MLVGGRSLRPPHLSDQKRPVDSHFGEVRPVVKSEHAESMLCPACFGKLTLESTEERLGTVHNGRLTCSSCGSEYPVVTGVALLSAIDETWKPMIKEILTRADIVTRRVSDGGFEQDREESSEEYRAAATDVMTTLLDEAFHGVRVGPGVKLLDVGAGVCETSARFADRGSDVVAMDVELSHLQYVNFWNEDEVYHEGCPLPLRNPVVFDNYFTRVMGDIHRIPFDDGTFDVTFCRSTIHHLDDVRAAVREMCRVTRPGGSVLLVSEPIRSALDPESEYLEGIFDYEEGLNERTWPVTSYTLPLRRYCRGVRVKYIMPGCKAPTVRFFERLRLDRERFYTDGEQVGFLRSFKLLLAGASVNVKGTRTDRACRRPSVVRPGELICSPEKLMIQSAEQENELRTVYRSCLRPELLPREVVLSEAARDVLPRGWREKESTGGYDFRYTLRSARCFLRNDRSKEALSVRMLAFPKEAGNAAGQIVVNGEPACSFEVTNTEHVVTFMKPPTDEAVLEIEIRNDLTFVPDAVIGNGDRRELGVAVVDIRQH